MNTDKHTVTIPIADYNKMLEANEKYELLEVQLKADLRHYNNAELSLKVKLG